MERRGFFGRVFGGIAAAVGIGRVASVEGSPITVDKGAQPGPSTLKTHPAQLGRYFDGRGLEFWYVQRSYRDKTMMAAGELIYWESKPPGFLVVTENEQRADGVHLNPLAGATMAISCPGDYIWIQVQGPLKLKTTTHQVTLTAEEMKAKRVDVIFPEDFIKRQVQEDWRPTAKQLWDIYSE